MPEHQAVLITGAASKIGRRIAERFLDRLFAELIQHNEHFDVLVNNAGIAGPSAPIDTHDEGGWRAGCST